MAPQEHTCGSRSSSSSPYNTITNIAPNSHAQTTAAHIPTIITIQHKTATSNKGIHPNITGLLTTIQLTILRRRPTVATFTRL